MRTIAISNTIACSNSLPVVLFGGINVLESLDDARYSTEAWIAAAVEVGMPLVFKASFDKANRSSLHSYRGPGLDEGLAILAAIKAEYGVPILTDIHEPSQAAAVSQVADVIQIPAFLARQTDLLIAAARTSKPINVKKPQFSSPSQMHHVLAKLTEAGNDQVMFCERGSQFGYDNLVVDMLGFREMVEATDSSPIIFDVTHSLQRRDPGSAASGGRRRQVAELARAGVAIGIAGLFVEAHRDPEKALCDGPSALPLDSLLPFLKQIKAIDDLVKTFEPLVIE